MKPYQIVSDEEYEKRIVNNPYYKPSKSKPDIVARAKRNQNNLNTTTSTPTPSISPVRETTETDGFVFKFDENSLLSKLNNNKPLTVSGDIYIDDSAPKAKRGRKKKEPEDVIYVDSERKLSPTESNIPYEEKYKETNNVLRGAIFQLDQGIALIDSDIDYIRSSKTLKRKYDYLGVLQGTKGSYIYNKISAARELNNTITKCNELELKRIKELHLAEKVDDDKAILDTYNAFINTPVGNNYSALGPSTAQMTIHDNGNIIPATIANSNTDLGYQNYLNNPTSIQHMMQLESNPNVQQVVIYNQATGAKSFEIMDMSTGEILQNVEKNDIMFLEDTTIDVINKIAKNINLNETYPLIVVGSKNFDEY